MKPWNSATSAILLSTLLACSASPTTTQPLEPNVPPPNSATSASANFEVHEWGLLRAQPGDVLQLGAVGPRHVEALMADKPVLYFHAPAALTLTSVEVQLPSAVKGSLLETWPLAEGSGATARWSNVAVGALGGAACNPSPLPSAAEPPCSGLPKGSYCEAADLAAVRTKDASCVRVGTSEEKFLFYRAELRGFTLPLRFKRGSSPSDVRVENLGSLPIPGSIVRIDRNGNTIKSSLLSPPAPQTADEKRPNDVLPTDKSEGDDEYMRPTVSGDGVQAIRDTMSQLGMTAEETQAFLRAWGDTLFGPSARDGDGIIADRPMAPQTTFLYFLPEASTAQIAELRFEPAPSALRRAFAVWVAL